MQYMGIGQTHYTLLTRGAAARGGMAWGRLPPKYFAVYETKIATIARDPIVKFCSQKMFLSENSKR